jgi:hypothetical protein
MEEHQFAGRSVQLLVEAVVASSKIGSDEAVGRPSMFEPAK